MRKSGKNILPWIKATVFVLLLFVLGILVWRTVPPEFFDPDWIAEYLQELGWWG